MAGYKGYARERRFNPNFNPMAQLSKVKERNAGYLRDLKERRQEEQRLQRLHISDLGNTHQLQRRNFNEIEAFEESKRQNSVRAELKRHEQSIANGNLKIQQEKIDDAESIRQDDLAYQQKAQLFKGLSQTAYNFLVDQDMKAQEDAKLRAVELVTLYGLPIEQQLTQDAGEQALKEEGDEINLLADQAHNNGFRPEVVNEIRNGNTYLKYELLKQYSLRAGENYSNYLQQQLYKNNLADPADIGANITTLRENYLKQNGLMGLKVDFMAPMLTKMRGIENGVMDTAVKTKVVSDSKRNSRDALDLFAGNPTPENFNFAIYTIARQFDDDGKTPIGYAGGRDRVFTLLEDVARFPPDQYKVMVEALKEAPVLDYAGKPTGETWGKRFPDKFFELERKRIDNGERNDQLVTRRKALDDRREADQVMSMLTKDIDSISDDTIHRAMYLLERKGNQYAGELEIIFQRRQQYKSVIDWDYNLKKEQRQGTLNAKDLLEAPPEIIAKWMPIVTKHAELEEHPTYKQSQIRKDFDAQIKLALGSEQTTGRVDASATLAVNRAVALYNEYILGYTNIGSPLEAAQNARQLVLDQITKKEGDFKVTPSFESSGRLAFYPAFTSAASGGDLKLLSKPDFNVILRDFNKSPETYLTENEIIPPSDYSYYVDKIRSGETVPIPTIFHTMATMKPGGPDARYYFNQSLKSTSCCTRHPFY